MIDRWFPHIELPISIDAFHTLPRNPAYKYEYFDGKAHLSGRPKCYNALLDLDRTDPGPRRPEPAEGLDVRPLTADDWDDLIPLFGRSFHTVQPFASLTDERRQEAARDCLAHTRSGGDGELIVSACFTAWAREAREPSDRRIGAALVTLLTGRDAEDFDEIEPDDDADSRPPEPIPHLTWIFVDPWWARNGVGIALLAAVIQAVLTLGYRRLGSSFLLGNEASTLWHWRCGFRLISYMGAYRLRRHFPKST